MTRKQIKDLKWAHFQNAHQLVDDYAEGCFPTPEEVKVYEAKIEEAHQDFLTRQQEEILLYAEEEKKEREWREDHWAETEGGDGYYGRGV